MYTKNMSYTLISYLMCSIYIYIHNMTIHKISIDIGRYYIGDDPKFTSWHRST